jgi:hypothetical protein
VILLVLTLTYQQSYFGHAPPIGNANANNNNLDDPDWTVYGFHFQLTYSDFTSGDASWIEAGGVKKYCYGPAATTGAACTAPARGVQIL